MASHETVVVFPLFIFFFFLFSSPTLCLADSVSKYEEGGIPDFDFERDPFMAQSLKLQVKAMTEECVVQKVRPGSQMNLGFEVLIGGDRDLSLYILDKKMEVIKKFEGVQDGSWDHHFDEAETVSLCFENYESRFSDKLVFFYLSAFIHHELDEKQKESDEKMEEQFKQKEDYDLTYLNANHVMDRLSDQLMNMTYVQSISKMHMLADFYIVEANNGWIKDWSLLQILVIISTAGVQVFVVRRMFGSTDESTTPSGNVRA